MPITWNDYIALISVLELPAVMPDKDITKVIPPHCKIFLKNILILKKKGIKNSHIIKANEV